MSAQSDPRRAVAVSVDPKYYYRRSLGVRELMPAIGAAVAAAAATFYVVKLLLERTPLRAEPVAREAPARRSRLELHRSKADQSSAARIVGRR
jgi:hypothetical protein